MITILEAVLLGVVQGVTEWLPISSSGHLVAVQHLLGVSPPLLFDILLHVGTLVVILVVFRGELRRILVAIWKRDLGSRDGRMAVMIAVGSIPTAVMWLAFGERFKAFFSDVTAVGVALIVTGVLLLLTVLRGDRKVENEKIGLCDAVIIGIAQGIAMMPGISRSGATISAGLLLGLDRMEVARFSFLLFIPAVIGAMVVEFDTRVLYENWLPTIVGTVVAMVVGYVALRFLLRIVEVGRFYLFSPYCLAAGVALLVFV